MGHHVRVLPEHRLGVVRFSGSVDGPDLLRALAALFLDPRWEPGFAVAWDGRRIRALDLLPADVARLATTTTRLRERMGTGRAAILVRGEADEITVQLLKRRSGKDPRREVRAFRRAGEAAAWLGVAPRLLEPPEPATRPEPPAPGHA